MGAVPELAALGDNGGTGISPAYRMNGSALPASNSVFTLFRGPME